MLLREAVRPGHWLLARVIESATAGRALGEKEKEKMKDACIIWLGLTLTEVRGEHNIQYSTLHTARTTLASLQ